MYKDSLWPRSKTQMFLSPSLAAATAALAATISEFALAVSDRTCTSHAFPTVYCTWAMRAWAMFWAFSAYSRRRVSPGPVGMYTWARPR